MNDWFEAEQRIERAQQLSESQQWAEALAELDAALAINPHNAVWYAHRGYILDELDRLEEAVDAYERALELEPGDRDVALALGADLTSLGRLSRALKVLEGLADAHPDFEPAYCHRIPVYTELGRHDLAEQMFYMAQELDSECPHCFFGIAVSLAARGQDKRAVYCWRRVLELAPHYIGVNRRIGQAYRAQGKLSRARDYFLRELRNDAGNTDLLYELADLALESGNVAMAAAKFAHILELDPNHLEARFALGKIWLERGEFRKALTCFETLERLGGDELPDLDRKIGVALLQMGRFREACARLRSAAQRDHSDTAAQMLLGNALLAATRVSEAADQYRRVLAHNAHNSIAHHNLGVCLFQLGNFAAGLEHCLQAIRFDPKYVVAMHNAAIAHIHLGQWREARTMLRRAIRTDPQSETLRRLAKRIWRYRLRYYANETLRALRSISGRPFARSGRSREADEG